MALFVAQASKPLVLPVIHHLDYQTSYAQAALALNFGADGVFFISHHGEDAQLFAPALDLKETFPDKLVGVNLLKSSALTALKSVMYPQVGTRHMLDMVWADAPGVSSMEVSSTACDIAQILVDHPVHAVPYPPKGRVSHFFASVAFKYQPAEPDPGTAAIKAWQLGMIPTTSGPATGQSPTVEKIVAMREALDEYALGQAVMRRGRPGEVLRAPLAIASGMTVENVKAFLPYATHFLVSTGISSDDYHFDAAKLDAFVQAVKA